LSLLEKVNNRKFKGKNEINFFVSACREKDLILFLTLLIPFNTVSSSVYYHNNFMMKKFLIWFYNLGGMTLNKVEQILYAANPVPCYIWQYFDKGESCDLKSNIDTWRFYKHWILLFSLFALLLNFIFNFFQT